MQQIEQFFSRHFGGEFLADEPSDPYRVVGPAPGDLHVLYCTKWNCLCNGLSHEGPPSGMGLVFRYGLPNQHDISWLRDLIGKRSLLFIGDLDPPDLLIFAWLRLALAHIEVSHFGVNDAMLGQLGIVISESSMIALDASEVEASALIEQVFPEWKQVVGPISAARVGHGQKIELEAVVSKLGSQALIPELLAKHCSSTA